MKATSDANAEERMEASSERAIPRGAIVGVAAVTVAAVVCRALLEDAHGFGWEASRAVLDAVIDIGLGVIVAALIIDRVSRTFTMHSMAKEGWSGFRLMGMAITDSLAELAKGFVHQYGAVNSDYQTRQLMDKTRSEVAGPPTMEGGARLWQVERLLKTVEEGYSGLMNKMVGTNHPPGQGKELVAGFENDSQAPDLAEKPLQTIDDSAWHLAELWPRGRSLILEKNLELQRSARRWRRLSMSEPYGIDPEFDLIVHRLDVARAAVEMVDDAVDLYLALLLLSEEVREAGISTGSDLDKLERMKDDIEKLRN